MKSHIMKNDCKRVVKDSRESYFLELIKPADDVITRIAKLWVKNIVDANEKMKVLEYDGLVRDCKQKGAYKNMTYQNIIVIIVFATICNIVVLSTALLLAFVFVKKVLIPYKYKTAHTSVEELYEMLGLLIQNEIELYERSIFENGGSFLNNQTFDNYYKDICRKIGEDISPDFYEKFSSCMNEAAVKRFIARTVRAYLEEKIAK